MSDSKPSSIGTLRTAFFSGLLLLAPLVVTVWAFSRIIDLVGGTFRPVFFFFLPEVLLRVNVTRSANLRRRAPEATLDSRTL